MKLKGKVAVIAGAGTGIGRSSALLFTEEGAKVSIVSRRKEVLDETVTLVEARKGKAHAVQADLSKSAEADAALQQIFDRHGRIDILYCNSGGYSVSSAENMTEALWEEMYEANVKSTFLTVRAAIPYLAKSGGGSVILTSAVWGSFLNSKNMAHYNSSKAAVVALTKSLALELAPQKIRVNCICPGQISHQPYTKGSSVIETDPRLSRPGLPEDVAYAALYFASPEAAWVSGAILVVDGGLSAGVSPSY
jgi:NAD(P)-dependent dehydrogenase (short-subunit alcohol dehydrogenase family)